MNCRYDIIVQIDLKLSYGGIFRGARQFDNLSLVLDSCSGGASAAKEPGHFEVRTSSSQITQMHSEKLTIFS